MNIADARLVLKKLENYDALDKRGREARPGWLDRAPLLVRPCDRSAQDRRGSQGGRDGGAEGARRQAMRPYLWLPLFRWRGIVVGLSVRGFRVRLTASVGVRR